MKELRNYQRQAIDSIFKHWEDDGGHGLVVVPTAGGKSLITSHLIHETPGKRILVLTHVKELVDQNQKEHGRGGIFSAALNRKDFHEDLIFASIQSIEKHLHKIKPFDIVIVDEAHLIPRTQGTRYKKAFETMESMNQNLKVIGLSATPYRLDSGWLHKGDDAFFEKIIFDIPVQDLIDQGYLSPVVPYRGEVVIDTKGVKKLGKEFRAGDLEARAMEGDTTARAVHDIVQKGTVRKSWLIFASGVNHARQIKDRLDLYEVPCAVVIGDEPRDEHIQGFKRGEIRALINVNVLTTGFNHPGIDLIAFLRPSESCGLYVQMVGRGMRISEGKENCLVLDYAGLVMRHGPIDAVNPDTPAKPGDGIAPAKECPECGYIMHTAKRVCPGCGYIFPVREKNLDIEASKASLLKKDSAPVDLDVLRVKYFIHEKPGRPDSIRVEYETRFMDVKEWIFPESDTDRAFYYFDRWCKEAGILPPSTAWEFLSLKPRQPKAIKVVRDGKFFRVVGRIF